MLRVLRSRMKDTHNLYGLHSFRVGGAQALALQGASPEYIMAKGRWKCYASVARYVALPKDVKKLDSWYMARSEQALNRNTAYREWGKHTTSTLGGLIPNF